MQLHENFQSVALSSILIFDLVRVIAALIVGRPRVRGVMTVWFPILKEAASTLANCPKQPKIASFCAFSGRFAA